MHYITIFIFTIYTLHLLRLTWMAVVRLEAQHCEAGTVEAVALDVFLESGVFWSRGRRRFCRVGLRHTELGVRDTHWVPAITGA